MKGRHWWLLLSLSLWLKHRHLLPVTSRALLPLGVYVLISSYQGAGHVGLGSTLMTSFKLNYLCKNPVSKRRQILTSWGLALQPGNSGVGDITQLLVVTVTTVPLGFTYSVTSSYLDDLLYNCYVWSNSRTEKATQCESSRLQHEVQGPILLSSWSLLPWPPFFAVLLSCCHYSRAI